MRAVDGEGVVAATKQDSQIFDAAVFDALGGIAHAETGQACARQRAGFTDQIRAVINRDHIRAGATGDGDQVVWQCADVNGVACRAEVQESDRLQWVDRQQVAGGGACGPSGRSLGHVERIGMAAEVQSHFTIKVGELVRTVAIQEIVFIVVI